MKLETRECKKALIWNKEENNRVHLCVYQLMGVTRQNKVKSFLRALRNRSLNSFPVQVTWRCAQEFFKLSVVSTEASGKIPAATEREKKRKKPQKPPQKV